MKELNIEEVKKIQLEILNAVDKFCDEIGIKYFIGYGTLLGAVRHKGYIPWDDDIDILMLREDYEKFLKEFNNDRNDNLEVLHCSIDKDFPYEFAKVQNKSTKLVEDVDVKYNMGINIDVFVVDSLGNNKDNVNKLLKKNKFWVNLLTLKHIKSYNPNRNKIKNIILKDLKAFGKIFSMYTITSHIDKISKSYWNKEEDKYLAIVAQRWLKPSQVFEKEWLNERIKLDFEGYKFYAPKEYDKILTVEYGDYMTPPPKEEQVTHHAYKAYKL